MALYPDYFSYKLYFWWFIWLGIYNCLLPDEGRSFNIYAETMASYPLIRGSGYFEFWFYSPAWHLFNYSDTGIDKKSPCPVLCFRV